MMEKYITDERTGLKYESVGDYYLIAGEDEPEEERSIGVSFPLRTTSFSVRRTADLVSIRKRKISNSFGRF